MLRLGILAFVEAVYIIAGVRAGPTWFIGFVFRLDILASLVLCLGWT